MEIGIDVGGTYTDAVLIDQGQVMASVKEPTKHEDILGSLVRALDGILPATQAVQVNRVTISTTLITNLIAEEKQEPVALILLPGPGVSAVHWDFHTLTRVVKGTVDFRGQVREDIAWAEVDAVCADIEAQGYERVAVVSKFSVRNPIFERAIAERIQAKYPFWQVEMGHKVGGELNFPRRVATTLLTAATREPFAKFASAVEGAMKDRGLTCPVYVLKADGGTYLLRGAVMRPVETIFSGPAASVMGSQALLGGTGNAIVIDTGGTTSDIALILEGEPLISDKGARVGQYATQVHAFAVHSVPVGGDSWIEVEQGELVIRPFRRGPAACMGGPGPTPTDALRILGHIELGDVRLAQQALSPLARSLQVSELEVAQLIADQVAHIINVTIDEMFNHWRLEPAYRLWELLQPDLDRPSVYLGVGGGGSLAKLAALAAGVDSVVPQHGMVANAVGAALAQPTFACHLRADTQFHTYQIQEDGAFGSLPETSFGWPEVQMLTTNWLQQKAREHGFLMDAEDVEVQYQEMFNIVRDYETIGRIYNLQMQTKRRKVTLQQGGDHNERA